MPVPESVVDGTTGRVCPADDVAAFAAAVRALAADPPALAAMGAAARRFAERAFDLERMTSQYIDLFEEVRRP